ncbi:MAG: adenylate/guanylate cyclase domain-containing protein, partial [Flavobacteriales bacterium]
TMRTGLHTGPVIAGIVGVKKYAYDIWGDTVNVANRMETSSEVGKVNISQTTYDQIKDEPVLKFIPRGAVDVKGKGKLNMYFVERA